MKTGVLSLAALMAAGICITLPGPGAAWAQTETRIALVYTGNILGRIDEKAG